MRYLMMAALLAAGPAWGQSRFEKVRPSVEQDAYWELILSRCDMDNIILSLNGGRGIFKEIEALPYAEKVYITNWHQAGYDRAEKVLTADKAKACASVPPEAKLRFQRLATGRALWLDPAFRGTGP